MAQVKNNVLPGFNLTLGYSVTYIKLISALTTGSANH